MDSLGAIFDDSSAMMLALLVFLATAALSFALMIAARARSGIKRPAAGIAEHSGEAPHDAQALRKSSLKAIQDTRLRHQALRGHRQGYGGNEGAAAPPGALRNLRCAGCCLFLCGTHDDGGRARGYGIHHHPAHRYPERPDALARRDRGWHSRLCRAQHVHRPAHRPTAQRASIGLPRFYGSPGSVCRFGSQHGSFAGTGRARAGRILSVPVYEYPLWPIWKFGPAAP